MSRLFIPGAGQAGTPHLSASQRQIVTQQAVIEELQTQLMESREANAGIRQRARVDFARVQEPGLAVTSLLLESGQGLVITAEQREQLIGLKMVVQMGRNPDGSSFFTLADQVDETKDQDKGTPGPGLQQPAEEGPEPSGPNEPEGGALEQNRPDLATDEKIRPEGRPDVSTPPSASCGVSEP